MLIYREFCHMCHDTQQMVDVAEYTEVEGGYGCSVEQTITTYECSLQDECRFYKEGLCKLKF